MREIPRCFYRIDASGTVRRCDRAAHEARWSIQDRQINEKHKMACRARCQQPQMMATPNVLKTKCWLCLLPQKARIVEKCQHANSDSPVLIHIILFMLACCFMRWPICSSSYNQWHLYFMVSASALFTIFANSRKQLPRGHLQSNECFSCRRSEIILFTFTHNIFSVLFIGFPLSKMERRYCFDFRYDAPYLRRYRSSFLANTQVWVHFHSCPRLFISSDYYYQFWVSNF